MTKTWKHLKRSPSAIIGLTIVILLVLAGVFAPLLTPHDPTRQELIKVLQAPSAEHLLGTDHLGRDVLSRILHGARLTLFMGFFAVAVGLIFGVPLGVISGYYGGWVDMAIQRVMDLMLSFTTFLLALALVSLLGVGVLNVIIAVGVSTIPRFTRLVRSSVLTIREVTYVEASRAVGTGQGRIMLKHVLPNALSPVIIQATLSMGATILTAAGLGFLGLGAQPPLPEWGAMISRGRAFILDQWWVATMPGFAIVIVSLGFCFLGDGLRDVLDPKQE